MTTEAGFEAIINCITTKGDGEPFTMHRFYGKPEPDQNIRVIGIEPAFAGTRDVPGFVVLLNKLAALQQDARARLEAPNGPTEETDTEIARLVVEHDLRNTTVLLIDPTVPRPSPTQS